MDPHMRPQRRRIPRGHEGPGAGAPRSLQDQLERARAQRLYDAKFVQPVINRTIRNLLAAREEALPDASAALVEREITRQIDPEKMGRFLGGKAVSSAEGDSNA